jgi:POT family proton-dependent oligopeptide transporter
MDSVSVDIEEGRPEKDLGKGHQATQSSIYAGLRRVPDKFPPVALLILVVEVCYSAPLR